MLLVHGHVSSCRGYLLFAICVLLARLFPSTHVQLTAMPGHEVLATKNVFRNAEVSEEVKSRLSSKGFSKSHIDRLRSCALLCGMSVEARLQSRLSWLFDLNQSRAQIADAIGASSNSIDVKIEEHVKLTVERLLENGLPQDQVASAITTSSVLSTVDQNLEPTVQWLLDLGLSKKEVLKVIGCSPEILGFDVEWNSKIVQWFVDLGLSKDQVAKVISGFPNVLGTQLIELQKTVQWLLGFGLTQRQAARLMMFSPRILDQNVKHVRLRVGWILDFGMTKHQVAKAIIAFPRILAPDIELDLKHRVQWLAELGLNQSQVAKVLALCPQILSCSIEHNLNPKVQWLYEIGLSKKQVAKILAASPRILSFSTDKNLKPKVQWISDLGLSLDQVAKIIWHFPSILQLSSKNLFPKQILLQRIFGAESAAKAILKAPQLLLYSYQRLSRRLEVSEARNESEKLTGAMKLTEARFKECYVKNALLQRSENRKITGRISVPRVVMSDFPLFCQILC